MQSPPRALQQTDGDVGEHALEHGEMKVGRGVPMAPDCQFRATWRIFSTRCFLNGTVAASEENAPTAKSEGSHRCYWRWNGELSSYSYADSRCKYQTKLSIPTQKPFVLFCIVSDMENVFSPWNYVMIHATIETSDENAPTVNSEESHHTYRNWTGYPSLIDSTVSKSKHQGCKRSKCKRRALLYPTSWALLRLFLDTIFHNKRQTCSHGKFREKQSLLQ